MKQTTEKFYCLLGTILCGVAGGIVGFLSFGLAASVIGCAVGVGVGRLFTKALIEVPG